MALTKYAVGGLQGCLVSVTGVAFEERAKICSMVQELGGIYSPELKSECSHLIFEDSASPSQFSQNHHHQNLPIKVQYALKWQIPVVSKEWIYDCFNQRILLEESDYPALSNKFIEGSSTTTTTAATITTTETTEILPVKLNEITEETPNFLQGCHIYLNGESISSQRLAVLKRLVLAAGGVRYTDLETDHLTHIVIHNQLLPNNLKSFLTESSNDVKLVHDNWLFDSFKEAKRLSEDDYEIKAVKEKDIILPPQVQKWKSAFNNPNSNSSFLNANPNISFGNSNTSLLGGDEFLAGTPNILESAAKILKGKSVYFFNGIKTKLISKAKKAEMRIVENELEADWCVTNVLIPTDLYKKLTLHRLPNELKNEIWFEAALDSNSHLPSVSFSQPWHCPTFPLPQASKFIISQSGFLGAEREFYAEIIKQIGAQYTDNFSKTNTHLLIEEPRSGSKYDFALKRKIECININWLKNFIAKSTETRVQADENNSNYNANNSFSNLSSFAKAHSYNSFNSQLSKVKLAFQSVPENLDYKPIDTKPTENNNDISSLFKGLVFASSQRLWHRRDELSALIESLGGIFLWSFDRTCTHYLHQGKLADEAFKEFRQARQWDKFIVSPWWVIKCKESGKRLDELIYPHTYKEASEDPISETVNNYSVNNSSQPQVVFGSQPAAQATDGSQPQMQSQNLDWNAIMAERKAQEFLLRPGSKTFNIEAHSAFTKSTMTSTASTIATQTASVSVKQKYQIVFSGYTSAEKSELIKAVSSRTDLKLIRDDETVEWNPKKTILICNALNFTEKIFSACATGCWILKKEFLFDESACPDGNFEKYELGPSWNANEREILIGKAPKYWRQRIATSGSQDLRPYAGWKCALIVESSRQALYESVLRNGGAEIFKLPFSVDLVKEITHFFCANVNSIPVEIRKHLKNEQVFSTKHITNTIFRLND